MQNTSNGMSTAALVLSIIGVLTMCCGGSVVLGSLAVILALLSRGSWPMSGQAKAAVGIGIADIILGFIIIIAMFVYILTSPEAQSIYRDYLQYYMDEYGDTYPYSDYDDYYDNYGGYDEDDLLRYYEDYFDDDNNGYIQNIPHPSDYSHGETAL